MKYQLEHLKLELESQRELTEYHSQRALEAELMVAFMREKLSRNSKMPLNPLTAEYGIVTSTKNVLMTLKPRFSYSKMLKANKTNYLSQPSRQSTVSGV